MARIDFDEQIEEFLRENRNLGARFEEGPMDEHGGSLVAVVCDRLEGFVIPDGMRIEKQKGHCYLIFIKTGEFLEIIKSEG